MARQHKKISMIKKMANLPSVIGSELYYMANCLLEKLGLFLTKSGRLSQVLGCTDIFDEDWLRQVLKLDDYEAIEQGLVLKDLKSGNIWTICGYCQE